MCDRSRRRLTGKNSAAHQDCASYRLAKLSVKQAHGSRPIYQCGRKPKNVLSQQVGSIIIASEQPLKGRVYRVKLI
jgi:hypothetical protein